MPCVIIYALLLLHRFAPSRKLDSEEWRPLSCQTHASSGILVDQTNGRRGSRLFQVKSGARDNNPLSLSNIFVVRVRTVLRKRGSRGGPNNGRYVKYCYIMRHNEQPIASSSYEFMHYQIAFGRKASMMQKICRIRGLHRNPREKAKTTCANNRLPQRQPVKVGEPSKCSGALTSDLTLFAPRFTQLSICIEPIHEYAATLRRFCMHGAGVEEIYCASNRLGEAILCA